MLKFSGYRKRVNILRLFLNCFRNKKRKIWHIRDIDSFWRDIYNLNKRCKKKINKCSCEH